VRALLAHRDARLDPADQALPTVDYRLLLATMAVVIVVAAACLAGEPRARKSPGSAALPPASDGQSRVPVGNIG